MSRRAEVEVELVSIGSVVVERAVRLEARASRVGVFFPEALRSTKGVIGLWV